MNSTSEKTETRIMTADDQHRLRMLSVGYNAMMHFIINWRRGNFVTVAEGAAEIPADVEVLAVHKDHFNRTFELTLRHPSFPVVPEGFEIPAVDDSLGLRLKSVVIVPLDPETAAANDQNAQDACRWRLVRQKLIDAGCPIEDGCHIRTVLDRWLSETVSQRPPEQELPIIVQCSE